MYISGVFVNYYGCGYTRKVTFVFQRKSACIMTDRT